MEPRELTIKSKPKYRSGGAMGILKLLITTRSAMMIAAKTSIFILSNSIALSCQKRFEKGWVKVSRETLPVVLIVFSIKKSNPPNKSIRCYCKNACKNMQIFLPSVTAGCGDCTATSGGRVQPCTELYTLIRLSFRLRINSLYPQHLRNSLPPTLFFCYHSRTHIKNQAFY